MGNKRKYMMILIILLGIGFGSISMSLYFNGTSSILARQDDFTDDVIFSSASMGGTSDQEQGGEASLSSDGKTITFNTDSLETVNDTSTLEFEIDNNSTQYDANVTVECTESDKDYDDYFDINVSPNSYTVAASSNAVGIIEVKLNKVTINEINVTFTCTLTAEAVERTSTVTKVVTDNTLTAIYEDENGNAVANAVLVVASDPQVTITDENGKFTVTGLESGTHHIYYMGLTTEVSASDFEDKSLKEIKKLAKSTSSFIVGTNGTITMSNNSTVQPLINLYNMIKNNASSKKIDFNVGSTESGINGIFMTSDTDSGNKVYYYRGNVDNNLVFNNMCWKIMRTTETGGIKLIYNGLPQNLYDSYETVLKDNYTVTNDEDDPFTYSDGTWTSTNTKQATSSTIEITGLTGEYLIKYNVQSDGIYGSLDIYINDYEKKSSYDSGSYVYSLRNLKSTDVIKIESTIAADEDYYFGSGEQKETNNKFLFSIVKGVGEVSSISCDNEMTDSLLDEVKYNEKQDDNAYIGYMYGDFDTYYTDGGKSTSYNNYNFCTNCSYYYGSNYTFNTTTGKYTLSGTTAQSTLKSDYAGYYTCRDYSSTESCSTLFYIDSYTSSSEYKIYSYDSVYHGSTSYEEAHANKRNSTIKTYVDNWYSTNFTDTNITNKIEDTVYCNDRSILTNNDNLYEVAADDFTLGYSNNITYYSAVERVTLDAKNKKPTLKCTNANDRFTVSAENGNGALTYPVGLITLDEAYFAGYSTYVYDEDYGYFGNDVNNWENYLSTNGYFTYWTMTPGIFEEFYDYEKYTSILVGFVSNISDVISGNVTEVRGARPVISLKTGTYALQNGTGTEINPYIVE